MDTTMFTLTFRVACLIATGALLIFCSWKFNKNESTSLVDFQTYHDKEKDIYPSFTICFGIPGDMEGLYDRKKLKETYKIENRTRYINFLKGEEWDTEMLKVDYDDVTLNLKDFVNSIEIHANSAKSKAAYTWYGGGTVNNTRNSAQVDKIFPFSTSFRQAENKCFSADLSEENFPGIKRNMIRVVRITFNRIKPPDTSLAYFMHYPKQFIRSSALEFEEGNQTGILAGDYKVFWIDTVDVIRRRSTYQIPCNTEWKKDDEFILRSIIESVGCKPSHWILDGDYPICNNMTAMKRANILKWDLPDLAFLKSLPIPCEQVQAIAVTPQLTKSPDLPVLVLAFKSANYKEIHHVRAFDFESLVGNMGGYVGLLLGFAFWQAPEAIQFLVKKMKEIAESCKN